jgi:hypothetical protein
MHFVSPGARYLMWLFIYTFKEFADYKVRYANMRKALLHIIGGRQKNIATLREKFLQLFSCRNEAQTCTPVGKALCIKIHGGFGSHAAAMSLSVGEVLHSRLLSHGLCSHLPV